MNPSSRIATSYPRRYVGRVRQAGVTMVEFAIVSPFALLLVLGIIQLGLMYTAKEVVNEAAFMAARAGSVENAQLDKITPVMVSGLVPFYQDTTQTVDIVRLTLAQAAAKLDTTCDPAGACFLKVEVLNPTSAAFDDFGITSNASAGHTYIPNDNLEYRPHSVTGKTSGLSIQDANALKIKVTYGYELKVPLMKSVINAVMCGVSTGLDAFGEGKDPPTGGTDCTNFYSKGRVPLVSFATVQMQTPAWKPED
jgi:hypothetical protein